MAAEDTEVEAAPSQLQRQPSIVPDATTSSEVEAAPSQLQRQPPIVPDATTAFEVEAAPPSQLQRHRPPIVPDATTASEVEAAPAPANLISRLISTVQSIEYTRLLSVDLPCLLLNIVVNLSISGALASFTAFFCWLIYFRPYTIRPQLHSAALITFDLAPSPAGNELLYDLSLNITFFNRRGWSTVHFDHLTTGLYYNGTKIGPSDDTLPSFKANSNRRRIVQSVLRGRASNVSAAAVAEAFTREREQGQFNLNVRVRTTLTYWFFPNKSTYYLEYDCWLQFPPVPGYSTPAVTGGGFKCGIAK